MEKLEILKVENFEVYKEIVDEINDITRLSYLNNTYLLVREIKHCRDIYLLKTANLIIAFFMVNPELIGSNEIYYLGLSCCRNEYKGQGFTKKLYEKFIEDCNDSKLNPNDRVLCYWTTASPVPYDWFNRKLIDCQPDLNGNIKNKELFLEIINSKYSLSEVDHQVPFILKGVAERTAYSEIELSRINLISKKLDIPAFNLYPINEQNGDRYLMLGYI